MPRTATALQPPPPELKGQKRGALVGCTTSAAVLFELARGDVVHSQDNLAGETALREGMRDWRLPSSLDDCCALMAMQLAVLTANA